jgi:transcriptional regulator of acetoin/glycerol metabolism
MKVYFSHGKESGPRGTKIKRLAKLAENDGKIKQAADHLGISHKNLWEKMKRYGIEK